MRRGRFCSWCWVQKNKPDWGAKPCPRHAHIDGPVLPSEYEGRCLKCGVALDPEGHHLYATECARTDGPGLCEHGFPLPCQKRHGDGDA